MRYADIIAWMADQVWAMQPQKLRAIMGLAALHADEEVEEEPVAQAAAPRPIGRVEGSVAVLPIMGAISHRASIFDYLMGTTSVEQITAALRQAMADPNIGGILLNIDSPGGTVAGVEELAAEILASREQKPIVAQVNPLAASAAYWIASAANRIVTTPSGLTGSIGVFLAHTDYSKALAMEGIDVNLISAGKFKVEANPFQPLTDEARAALQQRVDTAYGAFVNAVAKGRGVPVGEVRTGYGEGRVLDAKAAKAADLVDGIATLDETLFSMAGRRKRGAGASAGGFGLEARKRRLRLAGS